jgi:formylglycine-generating enzyme required for sulfatase activity
VTQLNAATANGVLGLGNGYWTGDQPAASVTWYQVAAFVNWLNTSTGNQPAYNLSYSGGAYTMALWQSGQAGYDPSNPFRNSLALYVLPTENEFYKAAYGLSNGSDYTLYATASDSAPTAVFSGTTVGTAVYNGVSSQPVSVYAAGGLSSYGTMGQNGNVWGWMEGEYSGGATGTNSDPAGGRGIRGGGWGNPAGDLQSSSLYSFMPDFTFYGFGFRVAEITGNAVPEPSTYALFALGGIAMVMVLRRNAEKLKS